MKKRELAGGLFWLAFSCSVMVGSFHLGVGTPGHPGMGFLAFWSATLLGAFSLVLLVRSVLRSEDPKAPLFSGKAWAKVLLVLLALGLYSRYLRTAGYLISTFLLLSFLFWIGKKGKWWWVPASSFIATVGTYMLFSKWLNLQFPKGPWGF